MTEHRVQIEIPAITLGIELPEDISRDHAQSVISEAIHELGGPVREFTADYLAEAVGRLLSRDDPPDFLADEDEAAS